MEVIHVFEKMLILQVLQYSLPAIFRSFAI